MCYGGYQIVARFYSFSVALDFDFLPLILIFVKSAKLRKNPTSQTTSKKEIWVFLVGLSFRSQENPLAYVTTTSYRVKFLNFAKQH